MSNQLSVSLPDLAEQINAEHLAFCAGLAHAVKAGELLIQAKSLMQHGEWGTWLQENVKFSDRTARAYMQVAESWPELEKTATVADLTFRDALKLLSDGSGQEAQQPQSLEDLEKLRFAELDAKVTGGLRSFVEVGQSFKAIKVRQLYKPGYSSFGEYCEQKWGMSSKEVDKYINASEIFVTLNTTPDATQQQPEPLAPLIQQWRAVSPILEKQLEQANTLEELKAIIDQATHWANTLAEYTLRCERKAGEYLNRLEQAQAAA